jgi:hypothetical protein
MAVAKGNEPTSYTFEILPGNQAAGDGPLA